MIPSVGSLGSHFPFQMRSLAIKADKFRVLLLLFLGIHERVRFVQELLKICWLSDICRHYPYAERKRVAAVWVGIT